MPEPGFWLILPESRNEWTRKELPDAEPGLFCWLLDWYWPAVVKANTLAAGLMPPRGPS